MNLCTILYSPFYMLPNKFPEALNISCDSLNFMRKLRSDSCSDISESVSVTVIGSILKLLLAIEKSHDILVCRKIFGFFAHGCKQNGGRLTDHSSVYIYTKQCLAHYTPFLFSIFLHRNEFFTINPRSTDKCRLFG